uniref:Uncharacterized protein n=1 Tax=Timspurckia oligopyrenoides TaxID=708627 RepID=A0A7S0ZKF0_9RHOD|mmetsp:Transcript_8581/g.15525  ORF Transcript_8581/g.15525 Transcript_8581/m.15525 type:complete len:750 (+) Transcript_8581:80-2329(+)
MEREGTNRWRNKYRTVHVYKSMIGAALPAYPIRLDLWKLSLLAVDSLNDRMFIALAGGIIVEFSMFSDSARYYNTVQNVSAASSSDSASAVRPRAPVRVNRIITTASGYEINHIKFIRVSGISVLVCATGAPEARTLHETGHALFLFVDRVETSSQAGYDAVSSQVETVVENSDVSLEESSICKRCKTDAKIFSMERSAWGISVSRTGSGLVAISTNNRDITVFHIFLDNTRTPNVRCFTHWIAHEQNIPGIAFSATDKYVLSASIDCSARLWRLDGSHDVHDEPRAIGSAFLKSYTPEFSRNGWGWSVLWINRRAVKQVSHDDSIWKILAAMRWEPIKRSGTESAAASTNTILESRRRRRYQNQNRTMESESESEHDSAFDVLSNAEAVVIQNPRVPRLTTERQIRRRLTLYLTTGSGEESNTRPQEEQWDQPTLIQDDFVTQIMKQNSQSLVQTLEELENQDSNAATHGSNVRDSDQQTPEVHFDFDQQDESWNIIKSQVFGLNEAEHRNHIQNYAQMNRNNSVQSVARTSGSRFNARPSLLSVNVSIGTPQKAETDVEDNLEQDLILFGRQFGLVLLSSDQMVVLAVLSSILPVSSIWDRDYSYHEMDRVSPMFFLPELSLVVAALQGTGTVSLIRIVYGSSSENRSTSDPPGAHNGNYALVLEHVLPEEPGIGNGFVFDDNSSGHFAPIGGMDVYRTSTHGTDFCTDKNLVQYTIAVLRLDGKVDFFDVTQQDQDGRYDVTARIV